MAGSSDCETSREAREVMAYNAKADRLLRRFGRNLAAARVVARYETAEAFADRLGIKAQAYRKYERGESMPPPDLLVDIRSLLGVTLDWLIANDDSPPQAPAAPKESTDHE